MKQEEILLYTLERLDKLRIPYFITGSVAVSIYGKPRFTHDIDIVASLFPTNISQLVQEFNPQFYISPEGIQDALAHHSMFNLIHHATGLKIDCWIHNPQNEFSRSQFERRREQTLFGLSMYFISPEDLLLQKLMWFKDSEATRHWDDAVGIWELQHSSLDHSYLEQWSNILSLTTLWYKLSL
ncbi:MAG: hypothetical protein HY088_01355 [Ignavibacteriales bacterium]|nr:hypothetical protein [Ignavibacteriales bacterium]